MLCSLILTAALSQLALSAEALSLVEPAMNSRRLMSTSPALSGPALAVSEAR